MWGGRSAMLALITALNRAFDVRDTRGFFALQAVALALAAHLVLTAVLTLILLVVVPIALAWLPLGPFAEASVTVAQWCALLLLELSVLAAAYRFAPATKARCGWITPGSVFAALALIVASGLFSFYVKLFAVYTNEVYGSVGGVMLLLTWLYLSVYVVLLGAEINAAHAAEKNRATG
jgi:membrane protein